MSVVTLSGFKTEPGRVAGHVAATTEAVTHLRRLGQRAVALQPIAGSDVGTIAISVNYASHADHAASLQKTGADAGWQEFLARASSEASAVQVESSIMTDVDPAFQPDPDRPMGVLLATQWRAKPGRMTDFMTAVMTSTPHTERMGGVSRTMQCVIGAHPMSLMAVTSFADLDAYGAYSDTLATDDQWQTFWATEMEDPSADLLRSGVYLNISGD
jgi:hypothetical protein